MSGRTISEKILARKSGRDACARDLVDGETVRDPTRLVFALDHYVPATSPQTIELRRIMRSFAERFDITLHEAGEGVGHQLIVETARALPGGPHQRQNGDFKL